MTSLASSTNQRSADFLRFLVLGFLNDLGAALCDTAALVLVLGFSGGFASSGTRFITRIGAPHDAQLSAWLSLPRSTKAARAPQ